MNSTSLIRMQETATPTHTKLIWEENGCSGSDNRCLSINKVPNSMPIKCSMLKETTTVDIERLSQTIQYLHAREKNVKGSTQRKAFDLLKRNFKLREFFKQLKSNLTRLESNIPSYLPVNNSNPGNAN